MRLEGFEEIHLIGSGGFSSVYRARQIALDRHVAIKVIESHRIEITKVQREVLALGRLSGIPGIITAYELRVLDDGRPALVMALMSTSLAGMTRQGVDHTRTLVRRWLPQVSAALDAAHARGVYHRDLKPENILISHTGDAFLADFGISSIESLETSTTTEYSLTPTHASPERLGGKVEDAIADEIYSLGSTVYASIAGRPPFGTTADHGLLGLLERVTRDEVPPIEGLPHSTHEVFRRALAKSPGDRYRSASEFTSDLAAAIEADGASAPSADIGDPTRRSGYVSKGPPDSTSGAAVVGVGSTHPDSPTKAVDRRHMTRRLRRTGVGVAAVVLLMTMASAVWFWSRGDAAGDRADDAPADSAWRRELDELRGEREEPAGLGACIADGLADRKADPAGFVAELAADARAVADSDGAPGWRDGSEERRQILEEVEAACIPDLVPVGTTETVVGNAAQVEVTRDSACALLENGDSACWGSNWDELGFDDDGFGPVWIEYPVKSEAPAAKKLVAAPFSYRCVISLTDELHCINGLVRQLRGDEQEIDEPTLYGVGAYLVAIPTTGKFERIDWAGQVLDAALGNHHGCVVRTDSSVWCVGSNHAGQLGDGTRDDRTEAVQVPGVSGATSIVAGDDHTCALFPDGAVWCWGSDGFASWVTIPEQVDGLPPIAQMAAGTSFTCGVATDRSVWCWGMNVIGSRSLADGFAPVRIDTEVEATHVDAHTERACFASTSGEMYCFGDGRPLPKAIPNVYDIVEVSISQYVTCGLDSAGEIDCVGRVGPLDDRGKPTETDQVFVVPGFGRR